MTDEYTMLRRFKARRTWDVLSATYGVGLLTLKRCVKAGRRPTTITDDQWEDILVYRQEWHKANDRLRELLMATIKYTDPELSYTVWLRHAICTRHHRLAERDNQPSIARDLDINQGQVSAFLRGERSLKTLSQAQRDEITRRYARNRYHNAIAQLHTARKVYNELDIAANTHARIVQERKNIKEERKRRARETTILPVHRFLLRKAS